MARNIFQFTPLTQYKLSNEGVSIGELKSRFPHNLEESNTVEIDGNPFLIELKKEIGTSKLFYVSL